MSDLDWVAWIARSPSLAKVTPAALASALEGFPHEPKKGMDWLARAIQGALLFTFPAMRDQVNPDSGEGCVITVPNATQAKLIYARLSKSADELLSRIYLNSDLLAYSLVTPERYGEMVKQVEALAELFRNATAEVEPRRQRWRDKRSREDRVQMAAALSPIFEVAFDRKPAVVNRQDGSAGPWPDFFQRIMALVIDEPKTKDLIGVLKEARKTDLFSRVTFAPGQIPE